MSATPRSNHGLEVFNASGELTFNSNAHPMRIVAIGQIPHASMATTPATVTAPVPGEYAACLSQGRIDSKPIGPNVMVVIKEVIKVHSHGASTGWIRDGAVGRLRGDLRSHEGGQILLVDVSGL